ncbi:MAG: chloride channel protein [Gomphosphaeria aponina SAG 52.96 = DSM 107014]|uniref:Chloride channel protein n=1 Tax=Gomphosphaeria aponina SAG 52.96 = DSM 107014 TaxID=1521640 RepID=A0A941JSY2_9CHRO|nr:chloride channel protein [Gomphosphaeria aponina SAG 52.96 = DSM 107014]
MTTNIAEAKVIIPPQSTLPSLSDRLTSLLNRTQPSPESLVLIYAILIGGSSGLALVLFHYLITLFESLTFDNLMGAISVWGAWTVALVPTCGGLIVGLICWLYPALLGQGFSNLLINTRLQQISPLRPAMKILAAAVSLGTGASLGPEGPSVEIGASLGILLGQTFQVAKERYRLLIGAGAAAGFAAGFNAPIAGVFFALEVMLGKTFTTPDVSLILLSAFVSAIVARIFLGVHPAFDIPGYQVVSNWEWVFYLGLGLLASLLSIIYTQGIKLAQATFQGEIKFLSWLGTIPQLLKPVFGGACVGLIAWQLPQILGIGYGTLEVILSGEKFPLYLLCLLLVFKLVATAISLGSGLVGGIFAPGMFLGACLGAIYGNILALVLPAGFAEIAPPAAYAMVGMAAVLASSVKAPLTAIMLLFELTQNYLIILPVMVAVGVSVWLVEQIKSKQVVAGLNLQEMGMNLEKQDDVAVLQQVPVATIMERSYLSLPDSMALLEAGKKMVYAQCHTAVVLDAKGELLGVISLSDIQRRIASISSQSSLRAAKKILSKELLEHICTAEILYAYGDESVAEALERMGARGLYLLPVVAEDNPRQVIGVIEKNRISLAGELAQLERSLHLFLPRTLSV